MQIDDAARKMKIMGMSHRQIKDTLGIGSQRLTKCINTSINTQLSHKRGRKKNITPEIEAFIDQVSILDGSLTDAAVATLVYQKFQKKFARQTICKIRKRLGFIYRPRYTIQTLTKEQMRTRVEFCQKVLNSNLDFEKIVFSDESRFCLGPDNT